MLGTLSLTASFCFFPGCSWQPWFPRSGWSGRSQGEWGKKGWASSCISGYKACYLFHLLWYREPLESEGPVALPVPREPTVTLAVLENLVSLELG